MNVLYYNIDIVFYTKMYYILHTRICIILCIIRVGIVYDDKCNYLKSIYIIEIYLKSKAHRKILDTRRLHLNFN